jgi:hypothetical protein
VVHTIRFVDFTHSGLLVGLLIGVLLLFWLWMISCLISCVGRQVDRSVRRQMHDGNKHFVVVVGELMMTGRHGKKVVLFFFDGSIDSRNAAHDVIFFVFSIRGKRSCWLVKMLLLTEKKNRGYKWEGFLQIGK